MPKLFDYKETDPKTKESVTRQGLFSKLGTVLSYTAVGLKDPGRLAEIQAQNTRAEQEYQMFQQRMDQQRQEAMMRMAENGFMNVNDVPINQAMSTPDSGSAPTNIPGLGRFVLSPIERMKQEAMTKFYNSYADSVSGSGVQPNIEGGQVTLQDAFPEVNVSTTTTPYISSTGKLSTSVKQNPNDISKLKQRSTHIEELESFSQPFENVAVRLKELDSAIDNTPDFKAGFGSKLLAKSKNVLADYNNEKWFKDYELAYNQGFLPLAQALNASKVLSDMDLENIKKSLGDMSSPKESKKKAIQDIKKALRAKIKSKLKGYGVKEDVYSQIYPGIASEILGDGQSQGLSSDNLFEGL